MPFGRYAGKELEDVPADYLEWALRDCGLRPDLAEEMQNQLELKAGRGVIRKEAR